MIEGYRVPNSVVATTMPEPYRLAPPSRSMVGILVDFGIAGVVAALVALFVTGALPISWSLATNGKTTERPADRTCRIHTEQTRTFSAAATSVQHRCGAHATGKPVGRNGGSARIGRLNDRTSCRSLKPISATGAWRSD
jgi:hypothetical protein